MRIPVPGDVLESKYRLDDVIGEGGFGIVYLATTLSTGRRVAAKFLKPGRGGYDTKHVSRFLRELKVIAQLQSPHTLTLFDYGQTPDGVLYMVCEYIDGVDLSDLLVRRERLTEGEALHVLYQLLLSLEEAHRHGVLHRDLKPSNIRIFSYGDDALRAKLLDFGIALSMDDQSARLTATGKAIGTPRYMSPEQLHGTPLGPPSDIYSVGLVFCEMLRGRAATVLEPGVARRLMPDPTDGLSGNVTRLLAKMIEPDVAARYQDAQKVLADVRALLTNGEHTAVPMPPVPVVRVSTPAAQPEEARDGRRSLLIALGAVALIALIAMNAVIARMALLDGERESKLSMVPGVRSSSALLKTAPATAVEPTVERSDPGRDLSAADVGTADDTRSQGCGNAAAFVGFGDLRIVDGLDVSSLTAFVPPGYDPMRPYPLLVLAHENAETPAAFLSYSGFAPLAERMGFVVVAPQGGQPMAWLSPYSMGVLRDAVANAERVLCIDTTRIYALGHGAGGRVVERIPCDAPEFAAIATTRRGEPSDLPRFCRATRPIPVVQFSPLHDGYTPVEGGKSCSGAEKISLATKESHWRSVNRCSEKSTTWLEQDDHVCKEWACEADFVACHVASGRLWADQLPRLADRLTGNNCDGAPSTFAYAEVAWRFLSQHRAE